VARHTQGHFVTMPDPSADGPSLVPSFPAAPREQWRRWWRTAKGAPFDKRLIATTYDG